MTRVQVSKVLRNKRWEFASSHLALSGLLKQGSRKGRKGKNQQQRNVLNTENRKLRNVNSRCRHPGNFHRQVVNFHFSIFDSRQRAPLR
jgi:hypothetical protein